MVDAVGAAGGVGATPPAGQDQQFVINILSDVQKGSLEKGVLPMKSQVSLSVAQLNQLETLVGSYDGSTDAGKESFVQGFMQIAIGSASSPGFWGASAAVQDGVNQLLSDGPSGGDVNDWIASLLTEIKQNT